MYEFAEDCGSMERSRYFGFSKGESTPAGQKTAPVSGEATLFETPQLAVPRLCQSTLFV
jgi:hypothetical protein